MSKICPTSLSAVQRVITRRDITILHQHSVGRPRRTPIPAHVVIVIGRRPPVLRRPVITVLPAEILVEPIALALEKHQSPARQLVPTHPVPHRVVIEMVAPRRSSRTFRLRIFRPIPGSLQLPVVIVLVTVSPPVLHRVVSGVGPPLPGDDPVPVIPPILSESEIVGRRIGWVDLPPVPDRADHSSPTLLIAGGDVIGPGLIMHLAVRPINEARGPGAPAHRLQLPPRRVKTVHHGPARVSYFRHLPVRIPAIADLIGASASRHGRAFRPHASGFVIRVFDGGKVVRTASVVPADLTRFTN